jgi:hypothetical protein
MMSVTIEDDGEWLVKRDKGASAGEAIFPAAYQSSTFNFDLPGDLIRRISFSSLTCSAQPKSQPRVLGELGESIHSQPSPDYINWKNSTHHRYLRSVMQGYWHSASIVTLLLSRQRLEKS